MHRFVLVAVAALPFAAGCGFIKKNIWADGVVWEKYESDKGRYRVLLPGSPRTKTDRQITAAGAITIRMEFVEGKDGVVGVGYADFPQKLIAAARRSGSLQKLYDGARKGAIANVKGKLIEERSVSRGVPGRECLIKIETDVYSRCRIFLVGNRFYILQAMGSLDAVRSKEARTFLESFRYSRA